MRIIIASGNPGKLKELSQMAQEEPWITLDPAPPDFHPDESGQTFFENARIKAGLAARLTGTIAVGDDSGLIVESLNGRPGIHSSRYCPGDDAARRAKLLSELSSTPEGMRDAAFMCSMVLCSPTGQVLTSTTRAWTGHIGFAERGANGFGYDPIFYPNGNRLTAAELSSEEKNRISHRGQAWRQILAYLKASYRPHP